MIFELLLWVPFFKEEGAEHYLWEMGLVLIEGVDLFYCVHFARAILFSFPNDRKATFSKSFFLCESFHEIFPFCCSMLIDLSWHFMKWSMIFRFKIVHLLWTFLLWSHFSDVVLRSINGNTWSVVLISFNWIKGKNYAPLGSWVSLWIFIWVERKIYLGQVAEGSPLIVFQVDVHAGLFIFFYVDWNIQPFFLWFLILRFYFVLGGSDQLNEFLFQDMLDWFPGGLILFSTSVKESISTGCD